ncbi:unnamed protein product [Fusarium graminearum]|uniref:Chromosome 1, complete genome n=2 Tax=Gibberella zeae TaxID=5518 RepID=A0A0E0RPJ7_GIBZE|nr:hypothetical protein FG05_30032 [Fusarium graminearum]CAF3482334.1 unnamed protein product [Fusarium graminearum]CAF3591291.1 unnamed protein product [Fusarium graminearum]CAG1961816.1 unnamed protein product [Fusarium graminearum]CAG1970636.1 unnamed protein product [Fusarium graminearum]
MGGIQFEIGHLRDIQPKQDPIFRTSCLLTKVDWARYPVANRQASQHSIIGANSGERASWYQKSKQLEAEEAKSATVETFTDLA